MLDLFEKLGGDRALEMNTVIVRPDNFLGIELNSRAAAIAQIVLWIGYFQWHRKTTGNADTNERPLLPKNNTIENRDAVLDYEGKTPRKDPETGENVTIWDGRTTKPHPVTGKEVPDESARTNLFDYTNPKRAEWPTADYIVGNPPFIGTKRMIDALGDGYTKALRKTWKGKVPDSADFVMYWWQKAAELLATKKVKRFGFITTNSIHQTFNRRVLEPFLADEKKPIHLAYAIPDHPWVDSADGAAVRISMTVATGGKGTGLLEEVIEEEARDDGENDVVLERELGMVAANLQIGADISSCRALEANEGIVSRGVQTIGSGFVLTKNEADHLKEKDGDTAQTIRPYLNGKDLANHPRGVFVIDLLGKEEDWVFQNVPSIYQHLLTTVKSGRLLNSRESYRKNWWVLGEPQPALRKQLNGLDRYIISPVTAKHRFFTFIPWETLPDQALNAVASDDAAILGIVSSSVHVVWALAAGGRLGVGNDPRYNNTRCFDPFPFPALEEGELKSRIRELGERLDAHRKARQAAHPDLTLTGMYNVLEKLRAGEALSEKEKKIHDGGLVTVLKQINDDLDQAVFQAYGWEDLHQALAALDKGTLIDPKTGTSTQVEAGSDADLAKAKREHAEKLEQELLTRLVTLNHERAAEEKQGNIRWLRPEYQAPEEAKAKDVSLPMEVEQKATTAILPDKLKWPKETPARFSEVIKLLLATGADAEAISSCFGKKSKVRIKEVEDILETLKSLGKLE